MTPAEIFDKKTAHILASEKNLDVAAVRWQSELFNLILSEYLPRFEQENGVILNTPENAVLIAELDKVFDKLEGAMYNEVLSGFVKDVLKGVAYTAEYYAGMGFNKTIINGILKDKVNLAEKLGFTPTGKLKKDGYLYALGKTDAVRQQLKKYVLDSLNGDTSYLNFQNGFRNLVIGNKRKKGLDTAGALQKYFDVYAYDSFTTVDASANKIIAAELGLKHFMYQGSTIDTSREFCKKRAGKVFTVAETKNWKNDPNLIDKKTKDTYKPLIERGRYRCRHAIRYITEGLYNELK